MSECINGCDRPFPRGCSDIKNCACECHRQVGDTPKLAACKRCVYFDGVAYSFDEFSNFDGDCLRYPRYEGKKNEQWCGEFKDRSKP